MRAVKIDQPGSSEALYIGEVENPTPEPFELLIKVKSFGINRMDIIQREGKYPPPKGASEILGVEVAGIVDKIGDKVSKFKVGDRVCGLMPGGAYAEYAVLHQDLAFSWPETLTFAQGAGFPENFITAYQAFQKIGKFSKGQTILIHAGASGVGTALIQLAKLAEASKIIVTAGSADKIQYCKELGAHHGINYKEEQFDTKVLEYTDNKGVNLIIDFVGADYFQKNLNSLALDGKMVILGLLSGSKVSEVDIAQFLRKRINVEGSGLRTRSVAYQAELVTEVQKLIPHIIDSKLKIILDKEFKWSDISLAHQRMEKAHNMGKIVVEVE